MGEWIAREGNACSLKASSINKEFIFQADVPCDKLKK